MSIDINLASKTFDNPKNTRLRKIKTISFIALFGVAFLSLIFFLINIRFSANYVRNEQNKIIEGLSPHEETASKIFILNKRLSDLSEILSTRKKYHEKADKIVEKIPQSVAISEFSIDESGIAIEVNSNSLLELNNFLNNMLALSDSKVISGVFFDGLTYSKSVFVMKLKGS